MKKKLWIALISIAILTAVGFWGFDYLGGNNPIIIQEIDLSPPSLVGKTYRGTPQDTRLGKTFNEIESLIAFHPLTKLHTYYQIEPAGKLDTLTVFIGIDLALPLDGYEYLEFENSRFLLASIKANSWVMPSPATVQDKLEEYASKNGLILQGIFIDKIISPREIQVIAPLK